MQIIEINQVTDELIESIAKLTPQLTQKPIPGKETLAKVIAAPDTILIAARQDGRTVGMLTLVLYRTLTAKRSRIEDVVVDQPSRGKGIARAMVSYAIEIAAQKEAITIDLTSNPNRKAANRLYENIGFKKYETNTYRYKLA